MADQTTLPAEDKGRVARLMNDVFTPRLQEAMKAGREEAPLPELLSASSMSFANMLVAIVGPKTTCDLLRGLADNVEANARPKS